jgi:hypothetical protein
MTEPSILGHARGFARAAIAPLWRVLQAGNDPNQPDSGSGIVVQPIQAATDGSGGTGASTTWLPGNGAGLGGGLNESAGAGSASNNGGIWQAVGGQGDAGATDGGGFFAYGGSGDGTTPGNVGIATGGSNGTLGQVLTAQGDGTALWQDAGGSTFVGARLIASNGLNTLTSGTAFQSLDTTEFDVGGYVSGSTFVVPTGGAGRYRISFGLSGRPAFGGSTFSYYIAIGLNAAGPGTWSYGMELLAAYVDNYGFAASGSAIWTLADGDVITLEASDSANNGRTTIGFGLTYMDIQKL